MSPDPAAEPPFLEVQDLGVDFPTTDGVVHAVDGLSFSVRRGQTLGIVGESGSGKTVASLSIMGLHDPKRARMRGRILIEGQDVVPMSEEQVRLLRGRRMAMIFQDPLTALHPYYTIGRQIAEAYRVHNAVSPAAARARAVELLGRVGIPRPADRVDSYPHELSGGMRQRAMIAMALSCNPELLIADEPTTALDVTVQAQILDLMLDLQREFGSAIILITHDLGVVARLADEVLVMYAGRAAECGTAEQVLRHPQHPYTWGLLRSVPSLHGDVDAELVPIVGNPPSLIDVPSGCPFHPRCPYAGRNGDRSFTEVPPLVQVTGEPGHLVACHLPEVERRAIFEHDVTGIGGRAVSDKARPILAVRGLVKHFPVRGGKLFGPRQVVRAVDGVDFTVASGETLGLVGESGCGKTTTGRMVARLLEPTAGEIVFEGRDIARVPRNDLGEVRRQLQIIFQDPYSSLNPRHTVGEIVAMPLRVNGVQPPGGIKQRVQSLLERVGLNPEHYNRYPHEFSGGQRQRIGIARALALEPRFIVADEPVSALDVSIQAQIINLLRRLQRDLGLSFLFIAHDLAVVRHFSHRVAVMYLGKIVEVGDRRTIYESPAHPYTVALLSAVPDVTALGRESRRIRLEGDVPTPVDPPSGCRFRTRCWKAQDICAREEPPLSPKPAGQLAACHFPELPAASPPEARTTS